MVELKVSPSSTGIIAQTFNKIKEFIVNNKEALLRHWNGEITFLEFGKIMSKVE